MRTNSKKYNAVISGYFDDFNASRCIADDENAPTVGLDYEHEKTHHGNHMNGEARLNPRYKKAYKDREDGDETHNSGAHEFLTNDVIRDNNGLWEGKAQVSYPDGSAQSNRAKFDGDSSLDSYMLISNGYNSASYYSVNLGDTDATNGRADTTGASYTGATGNYDAENFGKTGSTWRDMQTAHLCGVHMGEISSEGDGSVGSVIGTEEPFPGAILESIESPSGKPILAVTTHTKGSSDKLQNRIMSYHGTLGTATNSDVFGIRMAWRALTRETGKFSVPLISYTISVGFEKDNYTENGGFTGASAASLNFTTSTRTHDGTITEATGLKTGYQDRHPWNRFVSNVSCFTSDPAANLGEIKGEDEKTWSLDKMWNDLEIKFDWDAGTYSVLHDGTTISSGNSIGINASTGNKYKADEVYGWQIRCDIQHASPDTAIEATKLVTLIDRAYVWRDLSTDLTTTLEKMTCSYRSNGISQMTLTVMDDDSELPIFSLFKQARNDLQELMLFRDGINRCIWRGHLEAIDATQTKPGEKKLVLKARDFAAALDRSIPVWEIGQSDNNDEDEPVGWRPYESSNLIQKMYFGASKLERGKGALGINAPNYRTRLDSRARLNSAHPIQMYNEEGGAPSQIWKRTVKTSLSGFEQPPSNYSNPQSLTNPLKVYSEAHGFIQGESITIADTLNFNGTYAVEDPSTDYFYIDKAYTATGHIKGIHNLKPLNYPSSHGWSGAFCIDFDSPNTAQQITISDTRVDANGNRRTDPTLFYTSNSSAVNGKVTLSLTQTTTTSSNKRWFTSISTGLPLTTSRATSSAIIQDAGEYSISGIGTYPGVVNSGYTKRDRARVYDNGADWLHLNTSVEPTPSDDSNEIFFRTGDEAKKLYVGAKIVFFYNAAAINSSPAYTVSSIDDLGTSPFKVTLETNITGTGRRLIYNSTIVSANSGNVMWAIIDEDLPYNSETGSSGLSAAKTLAFPPAIQETLRNRNIHGRWIQDLPKSLWFQKTFGIIEKDFVSESTLTTAVSTNSSFRNGQTIQMVSGVGFPAALVTDYVTNGGVAEFISSTGDVDSFTFTGLGGLSGNKYHSMAGCKFFTQDHPAGTVVRIRSTKNSYKHIWVLWADMRNDGTADAANSSRKTDFGLLLPTADKYNLSIEFVDQDNVDGEPIKLTDLHIGEDVNIWQLDSEVEPHTRNPWSALGSNSESETSYHNWEDKAGAFVVIDTSKFWNLNTEANGGKIGNSGGGRTDLQDYIAQNSGIPIMMDNFWTEGMASYKNTEDPFPTHPNSLDFIHDASPVVADYTGSTRTLTIDDATQWADSGVGRIVGVKGSGQSRTIYQWYYSWRTKTGNVLNNISTHFLNASYIGNQAAIDNLIQDLNTAASSNYSVSSSVTPIVIADYDSITAYNTLSPLSHMRFMMTLSGFFKDPASNTGFEHDKIRFLNAASHMKHWLGRSNTTGVSDIQNVPITKNMATSSDWVYSSLANLDSFTSISDARGKTYLGALQNAKESAGEGNSGLRQTFTYQIGPDSRIELRPGYSSFHTFDRNTLRISNFSSNTQAQVTNVRVYFNEQKSFVDYPTTYTDENIRWEVVDMPEIGTVDEAFNVAKAKYQKAKTAITSISAEVVRGNDSDIMLGGARYGYVSDPSRMSFGGINPNGRMSNSWFPGMVNAMDGNLTTSLQPSYSGGLDIDDNYYWYGANSLAHAMQIVHLPKNFPKFSNSTGNQLRFAIYVNGFASGTKTDLKSASELVKFNLVILDPVFRDDPTRTASDGTTDYSGGTYQDATYTVNATAAGYGYGGSDYREIELDLENGYREVTIPKTYWADSTAPAEADRKIVISFNKEYLKALCRNRCGADFNDIGKNAHSVSEIGLTASSPNTDSIFPLGMRKYTLLGSLADERTLLYAPRLQVVDDINYRVSTAVKYTDSSYGYTNQPLILNSIGWNVDNLGFEKVKMGFTTDESTFLSSFSAFVRPDVGKGRSNRPAASGTDDTGSGSASGRGRSGDPTSDGGEQGQPFKPFPPPQTAPGGLTGNQKTLPSGQLSVVNIGASNMTQGIMNRMKGALDLPGGVSNHSILGSKRPMLNSIGQSFMESNQDTLTPTSGSAVLSSDGFAFPGVMTTDDTYQPEVNEYKILHVVPMGSADDLLQVSVNASIKTLDLEDEGNESVILDCSIKCLETGEEKTSQVSISSGIPNSTLLNLFSDTIDGAKVAGNTLEITLSRKADQGDDNAKFKTLKIHSVMTKMQKFNNNELNTGEIFGFES